MSSAGVTGNNPFFLTPSTATSSSTSRGVFIRHNVKLPGRAGAALEHVKVQNEMMVMVKLGKDGEELQHIRLANGNTTELKLQLAEADKVAYLHLSNGGMHAIVSTLNGENFYLNMKTATLRHLRRLRGVTVSAVGWNPEFGKESETGFILLGTTTGVLMETNIASTTGVMAYLKVLTNNITGESEAKGLPICSLYISQCVSEEPDRHVLKLGSSARLIAELLTWMQLYRRPHNRLSAPCGVWRWQQSNRRELVLFCSSFSPQKSSLEPSPYHGHNSAAATPSTNVPSALVIYPLGVVDTIAEPPSRYAWLSATGICMGSINSLAENGHDALVEEATIPYKRSEGRLDYPLDIALTEFHVILLYQNRLVAFSILDQSPAFEENFLQRIGIGIAVQESGKPLGMTRDSTSHLIWVFTDISLSKYRPYDEMRYAWRVLLEKGDFSRARKITSQMQDPEPYQVVIRREAEKFIANEDYVAAAELLAQSKESFESTVLKFLNGGSAKRDGLKRFLELKLSKVDRVMTVAASHSFWQILLQSHTKRSVSIQDKVKRDILVLWLLEIQLGELAESRRHVPSANASTHSAAIVKEKESAKKLKEEFYCFLNRLVVNEAIHDNREAVYRLIVSHVDFEVQLHVAQKLKDQEVVIKVLLLQRRYTSALEAICQSEDARLFHKYVPELLERIPDQCVTALIENNKLVRPAAFLPAFCKGLDIVSAEPTSSELFVESTLKYLRFLIERGCRDKGIHHFFVTMLATYEPDSLLAYLKRYEEAGCLDTAYDIEYALKVCAEKGLDECAVYLYCSKGHFETGVRLALGISLDLAVESATKMDEYSCEVQDMLRMDGLDALRPFELSKEYCRRVWLLIVQSVVKSGASVEHCVSLLRRSKGTVDICDILVDFPNFTTIKHFKEPLCDYLREHATKVKDLQEAIRSSTEARNEIKRESERTKSKYLVVKSGDRCQKCKEALLNHRPFVGFSCRHFFHKICLEEQILGDLSESEKITYSRLKEADIKEANAGSGQANYALRRWLQSLASDCPLCGIRIVNLVDRPFFTPQQEELRDEWSYT